ncbi:MAG: arylformamidase [Solirubrobacteraceae bacterium]|nr:arylformamidase [Solirubrobacteraceae bacterium]
MSARWRDISPPLTADLPIWPGSPGFQTALRMSMGRGDDANVSQLTMDVHTGTHVDAPRHFVADGALVEEIGLDPFVGPAIVVDAGSEAEISAAVLEHLDLPAAVDRLLLRTINSARPDLYSVPFDDDYAGLTLDAAEWLVARGVRLIGIDYLSVQRYVLSTDIHRAILGAGIAILEGIDLRGVVPGEYELVCLPLRLDGVEAAPARAILLSPARTIA